MTSNVDAVRRGFEALARGGVEELLPFIHPDAELITPPGLAVEPQTYHGHDGLRRYFDSFYEVMEEVRVEPEAFIEEGELVIVPFQVIAKGRATGIEAAQRGVQLWELRGGQGIRVEVFATIDEARAAARR
jgi:uncharacterized protein